jgi:hypothetical protein
MAFDAYAVSADLDDPLNKVLLTIGTRTEDIDGRWPRSCAGWTSWTASRRRRSTRAARGRRRRISFKQSIAILTIQLGFRYT